MGENLGFALGILPGFSFKFQKQAEKAREKAADLERRRADLEAARQRRRIVREGQTARANIAAAATSQGVSPSSSAVVTGQGAVQTDVNSNLNFIGLTQDIRNQQFKLLRTAQRKDFNANILNQITQFGFKAATGGF